MINKILLKLFLALSVLSLLLLTLLYLVFINTDSFLDHFENQIDSLLLSNENNYEITYNDISGSLSTNLTVAGLQLKDISSTISFSEILITPSFSSNFYIFIQSIFNLKESKVNLFNFERIIIDEAVYENKSISILLKDIVINNSSIESQEIKVDFSSHSMVGKELLISLPYKLNFSNIRLGDIINRENSTLLSLVTFSSHSYEEEYQYNNINMTPAVYKIKDNLYNLTINKCDYYYNNIKYYFISDFNFTTKNNNLELRINSFKVFNNKKKEKIDLYGEIGFNNMHVDIKVNTNKLNYFNLLKPTTGELVIEGDNYVYNIDFKFNRVKEFVENTVDEIKGEFTLNFSDSLDFMIHFDMPIQMNDKDYNGTFSVSDIMNFNDIYKPSIIVGVNRINPFKLNQFKQLD